MTPPRGIEAYLDRGTVRAKLAGVELFPDLAALDASGWLARERLTDIAGVLVGGGGEGAVRGRERASERARDRESQRQRESRESERDADGRLARG